MNKKRIFVLVRNFVRHGGASRSTAEVCDRINNLYELQIVTLTFDPIEKFNFVRLRSFGVSSIKNDKLRNLIEVPLFAISSYLYMLKVKRGFGDFIILSPTGNSLAPNAINVSQSCHKALLRLKWKTGQYGWMLYPLHFWVIIVEYLNYLTCKRIIAISDVVKQDILKSYSFLNANKISIIHHGVNVEEFKTAQQEISIRSSTRSRFNLGKKDFVLLFVGYEYDRKGLKYIFNAMKSLPDYIQLLIVGEDQLNKPKYIRLSNELGINNRVIFAGNQKKVFPYFVASDLFIFPTEMDAFGLVILEASACGLPVITTKVAGASELITNGKEGYLLDYPLDKKKLTSCISYLLENKSLIKKMSKSARILAEYNNWDYVSSKYLKLLENQRFER